ncbi:MAG: hypothetical protein GQ574_03340 [Crocinitomix sp.]|nr:hypothetical protein [Crocinitomix sp.]
MKIFSFISCLTLLVSVMSCGGNGVNEDEPLTDPNELTKVEGGKFEGGVMRLNSIEDYTSLFPASINDIYSTHIASQGYEGLLRLNQKTLEVEPCLAESFDIDKDKTKYTFHLRKGVKYIDDECFAGGKGREINANDFKYCFEFLCSNHKENKWTSLFRDRLVGANEYASGAETSVAGITVIDDYTLELELLNPFSSFPNLLTILAAAAYPQEAIDRYGYDGMQNKIVGSGPFIPTEIENGKKVVFVKNNNYWRTDEFGNKLPFLNQIEFTFIKDKNAELKAFQEDELDMIWGIPVEEIQNIMGSLEEAKDGLNKEFEVQSINSLNIQYYGFLYTSKVFADVRVRRAFNYAVDRDSLTNFVLQGEGSPAHNGFVPEMSGYPSETVKGFEYNPALAKKLMKEAGFPDGKGFPEITLNLNASGGVNEKIADAITYMLNKNLGVNIALNVMPMSELHPKVERGEVDFWRFGWIADYPDPSNFLYLFHGKNIIEGKETSINYFRYSNPEFDKVYEESLVEIDAEKRMKLYAQADQILMDDAVIMPLFFNIDIRLIDPDIQDFDINEMEVRDLSVVYYKKTNKGNVRVYDILEAEEGVDEE